MEKPDELAVELMQILQLSAESVAGIDPAHVAAICRNEPPLLLTFITTCEEQVISWSESLDEARASVDVEEALACQRELLSWEDTARILRLALARASLEAPGK